MVIQQVTAEMPTLFVDEDILAPLREQVLAKHGKLYGALREETAEMVKFWTDHLKEQNKATRKEEAKAESKKGRTARARA